jgi:hypothetical protein
MSLHDWAIKWRVSLDCLQDLQRTLGLQCPPLPETHRDAGKSEAYATSRMLLEASRKGVRLWRNNVGVLTNAETGRPVRFGLANESKRLNETIKSSDYIGWRAVSITPQHVGTIIGQAVLREVKAPGWNYTGTPRETAQLAFINMGAAAGCDAAFCTGEGSL